MSSFYRPRTSTWDFTDPIFCSKAYMYRRFYEVYKSYLSTFCKCGLRRKRIVARKAKREASGMARNMRDRGTTYATMANNANEFAPRTLPFF